MSYSSERALSDARDRWERGLPMDKSTRTRLEQVANGMGEPAKEARRELKRERS